MTEAIHSTDDGDCQRIPGEPARWFVRSKSRPDITHIVDTEWQGGFGCGCEQYQVRGLECKHIRMVKAVLAAETQSK